MEYNFETIENQRNKKECRKNTNKLARGVLIYELIMLLIVTIDMLRRSIPFFTDDQFGLDSVLDEALNSGTSTIVAVFLGLLFLFVYFRKCNYRKLIFQTQEKMTGMSFLILLTFFMSVQIIFDLTGMGIEACLNQFGLSILGEIESASGNSTTLSMLLYASFIGPISEEIIFRGFVMRGFQKYGDYYAIFMSAVIFGAFHGNLIQSMFAAVVGLILGYVAMRYSIKWSIILHIINNFVFGDLIPHLISNLNESTQSIIFYVIEGIFCAGAIVIILLKRNEVRKFFKGIKVKKGLLGVSFTSVWMLIFLAFQLLLGISGIEKLPV